MSEHFGSASRFLVFPQYTKNVVLCKETLAENSPSSVVIAASRDCKIQVVLKHAKKLFSTNHVRRRDLLAKLGVPPSSVPEKKIIGFFHPYSNAGGGGERVLWTAIAALQRTEPNIISVIYSGDVDATKEEIIAKVKARFDIVLDPTTVDFVFLRSRYLVEETSWPRFTLLGQSIGSMLLVKEAVSQLVPDLFIDTMGYAFTFHVVSMMTQVAVGAYIHYPTISTDMLSRVKSRQKWHTNSGIISSSSVLSYGKLLYYRIFMYHYSLSLRRASFLMANSSWTKRHIDDILNHSDPLLDIIHFFPSLQISWLFTTTMNTAKTARIVYPPCDTRQMAEFPLTGREPIILSVAQFRPEKDHAAQLQSFHELLRTHPEYDTSDKGVKLVLVGGCRNADDEARVKDLRRMAETLGIHHRVEFVVNAPFSMVLDWLSRASIGISTMVDEHFGINIVECMAAGLIVVTHASGGPLTDIVVPYNAEPTGYHATTPETFASTLHTALSLSPAEDLGLRQRARASAIQRFSVSEFEKGWNASGWRDWLYLPQDVKQ